MTARHSKAASQHDDDVVSGSANNAPPTAQRFADESAALGAALVAAVGVKNVTSASGVTQRAHHVCKNVTFEVRVPAAAAALDLTTCVVACALVYDGRAAPLGEVALARSGLLRCVPVVTRDVATLSVKIGVLSSQVDGALLRLRVTLRELASGVVHVAYTPPLVIVSKPYLALRAEGDRSKPKPFAARVVAKSQAAPLSKPSTVAAPSDQLPHIVAELAAQRRLLERLLSQSGKRRRRSDDDDNDGGGSADDDDDDDDDDEEYVESRVAKRRNVGGKNLDALQMMRGVSSNEEASVEKRQQRRRRQQQQSEDDDDNNNEVDNDNNSDNNSDNNNNNNNNNFIDNDPLASAAATLAAAFDACATTTTTTTAAARLRAVLSARVLAALDNNGNDDDNKRNNNDDENANNKHMISKFDFKLSECKLDSDASNNNNNNTRCAVDGACALFVGGYCPHRRELERLDAMYDAALVGVGGGGGGGSIVFDDERAVSAASSLVLSSGAALAEWDAFVGGTSNDSSVNDDGAAQ